MFNSEKVSQFVSVTGAPQQFARSFLESNGWDVARSVDAFLNQDATSSGGPAQEFIPPPQPQITERLIQPIRSRVRRTRPKKPKWDNKLAAIFKAPTDLTFNGSFEEAADEASARSIWILVNIQDDAEFRSHQLNRDVWGKNVIKGFVRESFIFWQQDKNSEHGSWFRSFYDVKECPFVAVFNPRTRLKVHEFKNLDDLLRNNTFLESMQNFAENNELTARSTKRQKVEPTRSLLTSSLNESNALERAIQESLKSQKEELEISDSHSSTNKSPSPSVSRKRLRKYMENKSCQDVRDEESDAKISPEPREGSSSTMLQIRFPSQFGGKKICRRFLRTTTVKVS